MKQMLRTAWRWLGSLVDPPRCGSCGRQMRRLVTADLSPEEVRTRRLNGTLGGLLVAAYVCETCTKPGDWVLIE
jgi:hypothetical protein